MPRPARIVNTQRPAQIPVDLRMEPASRTDLLGPEVRMWLRNMGVSYGTGPGPHSA